MKRKQSLVVIATKYMLAVLFLLILSSGLAKADISLLVQEALGVSGEASSAGHVSIYFSNICADTPVKLRLCRPGETGVVIALYPEFGTDKPYEWIAIPLLPFLYGVEDERNIPIYVNGEVRTLMRETYRRNYLRGIIPDKPDGTIPEGGWQQMIGSTYNRDIYSFTLKTTVAEDATLIEKLNSRPNQNHFDTVFYNCADFVREVVNTYFPHAAHRDVLNDFTMTSPKAVARSLTRYAAKRPERLLTITKYAQLAGPIRRSLDNRNYSEMALISKKYVIPQLLFKRELLAIFAASYFITGYFNAHREHIEYATPEIAELNLEASWLNEQSSKQSGKGPLYASLDPNFLGIGAASSRLSRSEIESRKEAERVRVFGTKQTWKNYQAAFAPMLQKAIADGLFADNQEVKTFFKDLELQSEPALDERSRLYLRVSAYGEDQLLMLTRDNILSDQSNPQLAYKLLLAKVNASLKAKEKNRESLEVFKSDWALLNQLSTRSAATFQPMSSRPKRFRVTQEKTTFGQKFKKAFVLFTH